MPLPANLKRRSDIIRQLCQLSRNGWHNAKPCDYEPLEAELCKLETEYSMQLEKRTCRF